MLYYFLISRNPLNGAVLPQHLLHTCQPCPVLTALSHKRKQPFFTLHIRMSWIHLDPISGLFLDMDAALFTLCRTKDQLPYAGCFWNFKSPFDLVVSIHAGVLLKLADEGLGATSAVSDCITCCLSWHFLSVFFWRNTYTDAKTTWQSTKCRNTQVCSLPYKYLSSLFIFNWLLYRSSPPFCLLLTWQMLPAPPSQGLNTWLDKSPRCVNAGPRYTLIALMHHAFLPKFYPNLSKIPGLSVYLVFTDPILFCNVVRDVFFYCWINYVTPSFSSLSPFYVNECLFPVFALLMVRASTCRLVIVFSPHLHFNAHWCKPSSVALALPSTREAGLQCERSSKCGFWSLPFPTNGFLFLFFFNLV